MEIRIEEDIPVLGKVFINFLDLSAKIFDIYKKEDEINRQKSSAHLGLISKAFNGINHSRYDYLILQCVISELAGNTFQGTNIAQGSIKINSKKYFGNDIIKSWFLISNFGHCLNTIGDEKALLLKAFQRKTAKTNLLSQIKDEELKIWSKDVIENFDYVNFHHILAIRRIYKSLKRRVLLQNEIITIYKLLLLPSSQSKSIACFDKIQQLKTTHNNIRKLAIISLDTQNSSLPVSIDILSTVLSFDFYDNKFEQLKIDKIFDPLISLLYDNLYLNKKSQTHQREYELKALEEISDDYNSSIEKSIKEGLAVVNDCTLEHFVRVELHVNNTKEKDLTLLLRNVLTVQRGVPFAEASVDYNPFTSSRIIDFYIKPELLKLSLFPRYLYNIANIIHKQSEGTANYLIDQKEPIINALIEGMTNLNLNEDERNTIIEPFKKSFHNEIKEQIILKNIPSFKNILWAVLKIHLKENYYFDINYHLSNEYNYFGVKHNDEDYLIEEINKAINVNADLDRIHELKQLLKSAKRKFNGYTIACLERITIYDYSKSPDKREVTDIDSLILKFNNDVLFLELHESKNTKKPYRDAKNDINKKMIKTLSKKAIGNYKISEIKNFGAKIVIKHIA